MKKGLLIIALLTVLLAPGCKREPFSYEGKWNYESSDPDLGEAYKGSWLYVEKDWDFTWWDASTKTKFTGNGSNLKSEDDFVITVTSKSKDEKRVYRVELKRLKDGVMEVLTESINGVETTVKLLRE